MRKLGEAAACIMRRKAEPHAVTVIDEDQEDRSRGEGLPQDAAALVHGRACKVVGCVMLEHRRWMIPIWAESGSGANSKESDSRPGSPLRLKAIPVTQPRLIARSPAFLPWSHPACRF